MAAFYAANLHSPLERFVGLTAEQLSGQLQPMYTIIGGDGKEYGPVDADTLRQWIAEGRADRHTSVKSEEDPVWAKLGEFPEFQQDLPAPPAGSPGEPEEKEGDEEEIDEGEPETAAREIDSFECLKNGLGFLAANLGLLAGATLLVWALKTLVSLIPYGIGGLANLVIGGILNGGLFYVFIKRNRGHESSVGDALTGFKYNPMQLIIAGVLVQLFSFLGMFLCILPGLYLLVAWIFALPLVLDKDLDFWSAMENSRERVTRQWFRAFGTALIAYGPFILYLGVSYILIFQEFQANYQGSVGNIMELAERMQNSPKFKSLSLGVQIVLILNTPFALAVLAQAYESLFGKRTQEIE